MKKIVVLLALVLLVACTSAPVKKEQLKLNVPEELMKEPSELEKL